MEFFDGDEDEDEGKGWVFLRVEGGSKMGSQHERRERKEGLLGF